MYQIIDVLCAGDRVVTDPLCKPFSMGRNLFCVHSRKRLDDIPDLKAAKVQQNRRTLIAMGTKFLQVRTCVRNCLQNAMCTCQLSELPELGITSL